jgi:hypothetical protein
MKTNYLFIILFCSLLKQAGAQGCEKSNGSNTGNAFSSSTNSTSYTAATWGKISGGKFYTYAVTPNATYPDKGRKTGVYTDGIQLTDEQFGPTDPTSDNWVGWLTTQLNIVLDLGKLYPVSHITIHALSNTAWGIKFPKTLTISTSLDKITWTNYTIQTPFPANSSSSTAAYARGEAWVSARYVKFTTTADANIHTFIDEIEVFGSIEHSRKYLPTDEKCYHGAYPVDQNYNIIISDFETFAQRKLKMMLWYEDMTDDHPYSEWVTARVINGAFANYNNNNPNPTQFILQLGAEIKNYTAEQISMGDCDDIATTWFTQCKDSDFPTFIRLLSEMNGFWTFSNDPSNPSVNKWGGNPTAYIQAWRRLYNIAERLGATGTKQVFVWSPHAKQDYLNQSDPQKNMENYYPGHQYVDWVGASVYNDDSFAVISVYDQLTRISNLYGSIKPLMISEGAMQEISNQPNIKYEWILEWWTAINKLNIKAAVWYNHNPPSSTDNFRIESSPASLKGYRPYLMPQ